MLGKYYEMGEKCVGRHPIALTTGSKRAEAGAEVEDDRILPSRLDGDTARISAIAGKGGAAARR